MYKIVKKTEVGANNCSAMETETIQKNGVSPKNLIKSRINLFLVSLLTAAVLSVGFASCSKDKDGDESSPEKSKWGTHVEVAIDGEKFTSTDFFGASGNTGDKLFMTPLLGFTTDAFKTKDVDVDFFLKFYINESDLKKASTGECRIGDLFIDDFFDKNFDLWVDVRIYDQENGVDKGYYKYVSGKHTVTNIKYLSTNSKDYKATYLVEGTFSCTFKNSKSNKTVEMTGGKYWTKLNVDAERK
jgi:hypothetical protein